MYHGRKKKPKIGAILVLGILILVADVLLLAFLMTPLLQEKAAKVFEKPPTKEELEQERQDRIFALRSVLPGIAKKTVAGARYAADAQMRTDTGYVPHARLNVSNLDLERYIADHPEIASPNDEDFIAYVHLIKQGIPNDTQIHSTDAYLEQNLNGGDAQLRAELLQELRASFYEGTLIEGWDTASYNAEQEQAILDFYAQSVFAGDSVMLGFSYHCAGNEDPFFAGMRFLAAGSYSIREAILEDGEFHPLFRGQVMPLWESIPLIAPKRAFLFFGVNDMAITPKATEKYVSLVKRIEEAQPGIEIILLSATHPFAQGARLNGDNITAFNEIMRYKASENGWDYVDVATPLSDGQGRQQERYCSDGELHMTWSAYDVWGQLLKAYAFTRIYNEPLPQQAPQETVQEGEAQGAGTQDTDNNDNGD